MVCGLLFYKPQLGVLVAVVLCLSEGRRAMLGVCLTGTALVLVNMLTMPGTMHEFAYHMPRNMRGSGAERLSLGSAHHVQGVLA